MIFIEINVLCAVTILVLIGHAHLPEEVIQKTIDKLLKSCKLR